MLVISGPKRDLTESELQALQAFVERGGKLLIQLDPFTARSLKTFVGRYGIKIGDDVIVDQNARVMGGDYQPMGHVTVLLNRYVYGMDPQAALDFPRLYPKGEDVLTESTVPASVLAGLAAKGHRILPANEPLGASGSTRRSRASSRKCSSSPRKNVARRG